MILLLIGPSNVGKSTLGRRAARRVPGSEFYDLDDLVSKRVDMPAGQYLPKAGNDAFLDACAREVDELASRSSGRLCLVAVGAGALQSKRAADWLANYHRILIFSSAESVYARDRMGSRRSFEDYFKTEYSESRFAMYTAAPYMISLDHLDEEQARCILVGLLKGIVEAGIGDLGSPPEHAGL